MFISAFLYFCLVTAYSLMVEGVGLHPACHGRDACDETEDQAISFLQYSKRATGDNSLTQRTEVPTKIVYGIFSSPLDKYVQRIAAMEATWAKNVDPANLLFVATNSSIVGATKKRASICPEGRYPGILCKQAITITTGYELGADWLVVGNDDMYIFPAHWEEMLEAYDSKKPQIIGEFGCGKQYCNDGKYGICGGWGYAVSRGALEVLVGKQKDGPPGFVIEGLLSAAVHASHFGDSTISCVARHHNVEQVMIPGKYKSISRRWHNISAWMPSLNFSPDHKPLLFHYVDAELMPAIHAQVLEKNPSWGWHLM